MGTPGVVPGGSGAALTPRAQLFGFLSDLWLADALYAAAKLGVADALESGPLPLPELAAKVEADPPSLLRLMRALVSVGVFSETSADPLTYSLTPMSTFLTTSHPSSALPSVLFSGSSPISYSIAYLAHAVKSRGTAFEHLYGSPFYSYFRQAEGKELSDLFNAAMTSVSRSDCHALWEAYDFSPLTRLMDVAGGKGQLLRSILEANPKLQGVLFDLPDVVEGTEESMSAAGLGDRFEAIGGSFLEAPQRVGFVDAIVIKNSLWNWGDEGALKLLKFCHGSLEEGGKLLIYEGVVPEGSTPHMSKLFDLQMLAAIPGAKARTAMEHRGLLSTAGFLVERIIPTKGAFSIIQALKIPTQEYQSSAAMATTPSPPPLAAVEEKVHPEPERPSVSSAPSPSAPTPSAPPPSGPPLVLFTAKAWAAAAVCAAAALKVPDFLQDGPLSADALSAKVGADPPSLYRLLRALAPLGLLTQSSDSPPNFGLTPVSALLTSTHPQSLQAILALVVDPHWVTPMACLDYSVRTGTNSFRKLYGADIFAYLGQHPDLALAFDAGMTSLSLADADSILGAHDFTPATRLLDVGGGKGQLLRRILGAYPKLHGVLLDLPFVVPGVAESFAAQGLGDRVEVIGGSFLEAPERVGFVDACVVKNVMWNWKDEEAKRLLSFCHASLEDGGTLLIYEGVVPEGSARDFSKCIDLLFMALLPGGRVRTMKEHEALLSETGFSLERAVRFVDGHDLIVAKK